MGASPRGNLALAAVNAAVGDRLAESAGHPDGAADPQEMSLAFPARRRALRCSCTDWAGPRTRGCPLHGVTTTIRHGSKLSDEFGYTALHGRYNTGLHVSENGQLLSGLLSAVVAKLADGGGGDRRDRPFDGRADRR
jgi:hypothetical protein